MFSWLRGRKTPEATVIGFGKVRALAEYLRAGAQNRTTIGFENWLTKSSEWAHQASWQQGDSVPPLTFLLRCPADKDYLVVGVVQPSRDAVGRHFPLTIAAVVPSKAVLPSIHLAPELFRRFLSDATSALGRAARAESIGAFRECVEGIAPPELSALNQISDRYDEWIAQESCTAAFDLAYAGASPGAVAAVHTIVEATSPFQGRESPPTSLGVRMPLCSQTPWLPCLWLHIVRQAAGWRQTVPAFACVGADGSGALLVQLGEHAPPSMLTDTWERNPSTETICDLMQGSSVDTSKYGTPLAPHAHQALESGTVAALIDSLRTR